MTENAKSSTDPKQESAPVVTLESFTKLWTLLPFEDKLRFMYLESYDPKTQELRVSLDAGINVAVLTPHPTLPERWNRAAAVVRGVNADGISVSEEFRASEATSDTAKGRKVAVKNATASLRMRALWILEQRSTRAVSKASTAELLAAKDAELQKALAEIAALKAQQSKQSK